MYALPSFLEWEYTQPVIGETLGSYKVTGALSSGGMGAVYTAEHVLIGRKAAIKVLLPEFSRNSSIVTRFFNEAKATAAISCIRTR